MFDALRNLFRRGRDRPPTRSRDLPPASPTATLAGDPRAIRMGDVVNYDGSDFIVEGTLRFDEGGFVWQEHLVVDGERRLWLSVEDDEGELEVVEWQRHKGLGLEPGAKTIAHEGVNYELEERGRANYTSEGVTGALGGGVAEYADYAAGDRRLGFERYTGEGDWEVSLGTKISPHALDIYPSRGGS